MKKLKRAIFILMVVTLFFSSVVTEASVTYQYDSIRRLINIEYGTDGKITYHYDSNGNMTARTIETSEIQGDVEGFVTRIYQNVLGRAPEPDGLAFWSSGLRSGTENASGIIYEFFFSSEFLEKEVSDTEFISISYRTFMDREPDEGGMAHWLHTLQSGFNRRYVLEQMMTSNEFTAICAAYGINLGAVIGVEGFVARMYRYVLNRKYDKGGLDFWVTGLLSGHETGATIAEAFFFDWEFEKRNVNDLELIILCYTVFMNRDPDQEGLRFWLGVLEGGASRRLVLKDMIDGDEFKRICDNYGITVGQLTLPENITAYGYTDSDYSYEYTNDDSTDGPITNQIEYSDDSTDGLIENQTEYTHDIPENDVLEEDNNTIKDNVIVKFDGLILPQKKHEAPEPNDISAFTSNGESYRINEKGNIIKRVSIVGAFGSYLKTADVFFEVAFEYDRINRKVYCIDSKIDINPSSPGYFHIFEPILEANQAEDNDWVYGSAVIQWRDNIQNLYSTEYIEIRSYANGDLYGMHNNRLWPIILNPSQPGQGQRHAGEIPQCIQDPVDIINGNLIWEYTDIELYGAQNLSFGRHYNSQDKYITSIGAGWQHSFDYTLQTYAVNAFRVTVPNGYSYSFLWNGSEFKPAEPENVRFEWRDNTYIFTNYDETRVVFDGFGFPISIIDLNGNTTTLTYNDGQLSHAENRAGTLTFGYNPRGLVSSVSDNHGRSVSYEYDDSYNLSTFTNADKHTLVYTYGSNALASNHNLLTVKDFNGKVYMENKYFGEQVVEQYLADQGRSYFEYDPENRVNTFTNPEGWVTEYHYDERFKITKTEEYQHNENNIDNPGIRSQKFEDGLLRWSIDYMGNKTEYGYDSQGNRTSVTYPDGSVERFTYNTKRQVTQAVARDGSKTDYTYDNQGNLTSLTIIPVQGENRVRSFIYNENNDLLSYTDATGATTSYSYDDKGNRLSMTDTTGKITRYTYDDLGRLRTQNSPMNEVTTFEYTPAGKLTRIIHPNPDPELYPDGIIETFDVNGNGFNTRQTDPMGFFTETTYDGMNNPMTVTDSEGGTISYEYDSSGNLTRIKDPMEISTQFDYDSKGRLISTTDENGNKWTYKYDANGRLTETHAPSQANVSTNVYDNMGQMTASTNAKNATTRYVYDNMGRVTVVADPLGGELSYQYDGYGNVKSTTDPNGNTWHYTYDKEDRLLTTIDPVNGETKPSIFVYDEAGRLTKTVSPAGVAYEYTYNANGYLSHTRDALERTYINHYDALGRLTRRTNPDATFVSYSYDKNGRLTKAIDENGNSVSYTYDKNGNVLTITDELENITQFQYDKNNRLTKVTDALNSETTYRYDNNGNLKSITDANGNRTEWDYNFMNLPTAERRLSGDETYTQRRFSYNDVGEMTTLMNGRGASLAFEYDLNGRVTSGAGIGYTYDKNDNVLTVTNENGTTVREYDALNRVKEFTDANGNKIKYEYDADGRIKTLTYPGGKSVTYEYNQAGQLTKVTDYNNRITAYEYDQNGRLKTTIKPDGSVEMLIYDKAGRITSKRTVKATNGTEVVINDYSYSYYANGDIECETNNITGIGITLPEGNTAMTYGNGNQLATYNRQTVEHDADGNMTTGPLGDTFAAFTYNNLNMLTQAGATAYTYDGEGNRVSQTVNGQTTTYVTDPNAELSRLLITNKPDGSQTFFVYGLGLISQERVINNVTQDYRLFHFDYRGSTTGLTDLNGNVTDRWAYDPFGILISREGHTETPFLYIGQHGVETDSNGLYFMRARYYSPQISRLINEDPIKSGSNWYSYAGNNPINNIDPDGKVAITATATFAGVSIAKALGGVATVGVAGYLWFSEPEIGTMNDALAAQTAIISSGGNQPTDPNNGGRIVAGATAGAIVLNSTLSTVNPGQKQIKIRYEDNKTVVFTDANGVTRSVSREEFNKLYGRNATADSYNNKFNPCPDGVSGNTPKNIYSSIKQAPQYPSNFQAVKNGITKNNVNNQQLFNELRAIEPGRWQKVYRDGYVNGQEVSIHYFESPSGKVFDVQVHWGKWSNQSSGR